MENADILRIAKEAISSITFLLLIPAILGWGMMNCLFELLGAMGVSVKRNKKFKCWLYTSLILVLFAVLIKAFTFQS